MAASLSRAEDCEAQTLTRKVVEMAMTGDLTALRLCTGRLSPAPQRARDPPASQRRTRDDHD
jgi:hypothetical protein